MCISQCIWASDGLTLNAVMNGVDVHVNSIHDSIGRSALKLT